MQHLLKEAERAEPSTGHPATCHSDYPQESNQEERESFDYGKMLEGSNGATGHCQGTAITVHERNTSPLEPPLINDLMEENSEIGVGNQ